MMPKSNEQYANIVIRKKNSLEANNRLLFELFHDNIQSGPGARSCTEVQNGCLSMVRMADIICYCLF